MHKTKKLKNLNYIIDNKMCKWYSLNSSKHLTKKGGVIDGF